MKVRLHDKKAGIAILAALIIISLAEVVLYGVTRATKVASEPIPVLRQAICVPRQRGWNDEPLLRPIGRWRGCRTTLLECLMLCEMP